MIRFIAGTPRSGTTYLTRALNIHPNVAAFGETSFWGRGYHQPGPNGTYTPHSLRKVLTAIKAHELPVTIGKKEPGFLKNVTQERMDDIVDQTFSDDQTHLTPSEVFCRFGEAIAHAEGKQYWVEKTPHHVMWADRIFQALPNARLVILLREPYAFMRSYKSKMEVNLERGERPDVYHPLRCAFVWRSTARAVLRLIDRYPGKIFMIKTHELHRDPIGMLEKVVSFFRFPQIKWDPEVLPSRNTNTFFVGDTKPEVLDIDRAWMNIIAKSEIHGANFDYIPSSITKISFIWSLLILPKWVLQTYRHMDRNVPGSTLKYLGRWIVPSRFTRRGRKG